MKPYLVGETNPVHPDPCFALYPEPKGCSGYRLCHLVLQLQPAVYLRDFERRDLLVGKWSLPRAREAAFKLAEEIGDAKVVLLGAKVCAAFRLDFEPFTIVRGKAVILPHPSGLCRIWHQPGSFERAREVLRRAGVLVGTERVA